MSKFLDNSDIFMDALVFGKKRLLLADEIGKVLLQFID